MERLNEEQRLDLLKMNSLYAKYEKKIKVFTAIEKVFENYTPNQIVGLFYSSFHPEDLKYKLMNEATKIKDLKPFPVFKRMRELFNYIDYMDNTEYPDENLPIEGYSPLGPVGYVKDYTELVATAKFFSNCLRSYGEQCASGKYNVYRIIDRDDPIVFHVDKTGRIIEIKQKLIRL